MTDCDCNSIDIVIVVKCIASRFFKYCLSIKKTLSFILSVVCFDVCRSDIEAFELTIVCEDVVISVEVMIVLSVNSEVRFDLSFVIRFDVSNSTISFENNVILKNKAFINGSAVMIDDLAFNLLFLIAFFNLGFSCRLRYIILLLS